MSYEPTITGDVDDLRKDADTIWDPARETLAAVREMLPTDLPDYVYSFIPGAREVWQEMKAASESVETYLLQGEVALTALRDAVLWAALDIIGTEASVQDDIAEIREQLRS